MTLRPRALPTRIVLSVVAAAAVTVAGLAPASASQAAMSCVRWQALHVTGTDGHPYIVRNKPSINNNDEGMCLSVPGAGAAFTVARSPGTAPSPTVRAYPDLAWGCFEAACAPANPVYPRAGALGNYTITWSTVMPANSGIWNSSLDLWLGPHSGDGAYEIMIWLKYSGPNFWVGRYPEVYVDGTYWWVVPHQDGPGQHYLSFRRATPAAGASLRLAPFMTEAERFGGVSPSALLWSAQAGFEIWSGGTGLAITRFSITG